MRKDRENIFQKNKKLYEDTVRKFVCEHCVDLTDDGKCATHDAEGCAVFRYLPELVEIALDLHELRLDPYEQAIRSKLCTQCKNSGGTENCELRELVDCGLNRYLPMVLSAIEDVNEKLGLK